MSFTGDNSKLLRKGAGHTHHNHNWELVERKMTSLFQRRGEFAYVVNYFCRSSATDECPRNL